MENSGKGILEQIKSNSGNVSTFAPLTGDSLKGLMIDLSAIPSSPSKSVEDYFETIRKTGVVWKEASKVGSLTTVDEFGNPISPPLVYGTPGPVDDPEGAIKKMFDEAALLAQRKRLMDLKEMVDFNWLVEEADLNDPDFLVDDVAEEERELLIGMIREEREKLDYIKQYPLTPDDMEPVYPGLTEEKLKSAIDAVMLSDKGMKVLDPKSHFVVHGGAELMKEMAEFTRKAEEKLWFGNDATDETKEGLMILKSRGYGKSYATGGFMTGSKYENERRIKESNDERARQKGKFSDFFRRNKW